MSLMIPAGTTIIRLRADGQAESERLTAPLEFAHLPPGWEKWATISTPSGNYRVPRAAVRPVPQERARVDTHGWRDRDDD